MNGPTRGRNDSRPRPVTQLRIHRFAPPVDSPTVAAGTWREGNLDVAILSVPHRAAYTVLRSL